METVECLSSYNYPDRPTALLWEGYRLEIIEILAEWRTPSEKHFRVQTADRQTFELSYGETSTEWQIRHL